MTSKIWIFEPRLSVFDHVKPYFTNPKRDIIWSKCLKMVLSLFMTIFNRNLYYRMHLYGLDPQYLQIIRIYCGLSAYNADNLHYMQIICILGVKYGTAEAQMPRSPNAQMPRSPDAQIPRSPDAQNPRFRDTQIQDVQKPRSF